MLEQVLAKFLHLGLDVPFLVAPTDFDRQSFSHV
jgi:hypothetical protein